MLDLERFESLASAMDAVANARQPYVQLAKDVVRPGGISAMSLFFMSALSRAQGLHDAIGREIRESNPHAVFPLMRAYAETSLVVLYVIDHPKYVFALQSHPSERKQEPKRKSIQALIHHAASRFCGLKNVYAELSEIAHFGSLGMWASIAPLGEPGRIRWTSYPSWRDERTALIACAQALELAEACQELLRELSDRYLKGMSPAS